jgi:4-hydroxybenzoyl-CoA reductase subunit beta
MMPLPRFEVARPRDLETASRLLAEGAAAIVAGGTDLLVQLKHRRHAPRRLVTLDGIDALRGIHRDGDWLVVGAAERLAAIASSPLVRAMAPALAEAAGAVAHPQIRNVGTLGGNLCLDVRCRWVNRPATWREALGGCLKSEGDRCHVVEKGRRCVAALSADTIPALTALGAEARVFGQGAVRHRPVADLRTGDGVRPVDLAPGEIVTEVRVPIVAGRRSAYLKWAVRKAVDFPLVSAGLVIDLDDGHRIRDVAVVAGVLGPKPKVVAGLDRMRGRILDGAVAAEIAERTIDQCRPLPNVLYDPAYRRRLLGVLVRRQLQTWAS